MKVIFLLKPVSKKKKVGRERGAVGKQNVALLAKLTLLEDIETGKVSNQYRCFKAKVLTSHTADEINATIKEYID